MNRLGEFRRFALAALLGMAAGAVLVSPAVAQEMMQYLGLGANAEKIQMPRMKMPAGLAGAGSVHSSGKPGSGKTVAGKAGAAGCGGSGETPPKLVSQVKPEYSDEARKDKVEGAVLLSVMVSAKGQAAKVHVVQGLGHGLDEKAMEAVRQWKFEPGKKDGCPVEAEVYVRAKFRMGE